jgi:hypothetical protein
LPCLALARSHARTHADASMAAAVVGLGFWGPLGGARAKAKIGVSGPAWTLTHTFSQTYMNNLAIVLSCGSLR